MKFTVINIANKMPGWIDQGCTEYLTRINNSKHSAELIELKADKNPHKPTLEVMAQEMQKITASIPKNSYVIALDERARQFSSVAFAANLEKINLNYQHITFIIGGADGIHPQLKSQAQQNISLSSLVFPHSLVRIIILEQIYRAISILENHPYHRV